MYEENDWVGIRPVRDAGQVKKVYRMEDLYDVLRMVGASIEKYAGIDLFRLTSSWIEIHEDFGSGESGRGKLTTRYRLSEGGGAVVVVSYHPMGRLPRDARP